MSDLLQQLTETPVDALLNWRQIREEIHNEHERATSTDYRVALLAMFKTTMDIAETTIAPDDLKKFKEARLQDYHLLIIREALVGENVCTETLDGVTRREVAAGRMAPDDELRKTAILGMAAPHLSRTELIAMDAQKLAEATTSPLKGWRRLLAWFRRH